MAISFVGQVSDNNAGLSSVTAPAHAAGDILILFERSANTTPPATPSGWTSIIVEPSSGGIGNAYRVSYLIDTAGTITSVPTATTDSMLLVYSGVSGIGATALDPYDLGPNSIAFPALTLDAGGQSWVVGVAAINQGDTLAATGGMTGRTSVVGFIGADSNTSVTAVAGSATWSTGAYVSAVSIELLASGGGGGGPTLSRIWNTVSTAWRDTVRIWNTVSTTWRDGTRLWATVSGYVLPAPPAGGTIANPAAPGASTTTISARESYHLARTMTAIDQRDSSTVPLLDVSISTDADSVVWSMRATVGGGAATFSQLTTGDTPVTLLITLSGLQWAFVVDSVSRSRAHNADQVSLVGRSITAACGTPFQPETNWTNNGATTGAQLAALSNLYTGVQVEWGVTDWIIPDQVFTFSGTPMAVVKRVADTIGAIVTSHPTEPLLYVRPRYPLMPNAWVVGSPDVDVAFEAVVAESFERADRPGYTGVYLSGQQGGSLGYVRLDGTNGGTLHPLVTDLLLTEDIAIRQRGEAILGASGEQARVTLTLPVLTGSGEPGVLSLNQIVQIQDPAGAWRGLVRAISVQATHGSLTQSVTLERHTRLIEGTTIAV